MLLSSLPSHVLNSILYHVQGMFCTSYLKTSMGESERHITNSATITPRAIILTPMQSVSPNIFYRNLLQTTYKFLPPLFSHKIIIFSSNYLSTRYQLRNFIFSRSRMLHRVVQRRREFLLVNEVYFLQAEKYKSRSSVIILSSLVKMRLQSQILLTCISDCRKQCLGEVLMLPSILYPCI